MRIEEYEIGKTYKSLAGCPVKLIRKYYAPYSAERVEDMVWFAEVEYIDPINNYGYGQGAIGWFRLDDLTAIEECPYCGDISGRCTCPSQLELLQLMSEMDTDDDEGMTETFLRGWDDDEDEDDYDDEDGTP
jgi:hypothetical protein